MNRREALHWFTGELKKINNPEAGAEARHALSSVLGCSISELLLHADVQLEEGHLVQLEQVLAGRKQNKPLAYLLGERYFMGLPFYVAPGVLIPRQETELLAEAAITLVRCHGLKQVHDLCTGTGCIAISIAKETEATVSASDISEEALAIAKRNNEVLGTDVVFKKANLLKGIEGSFDLITANPPYIETDVYKTLEDQVRLYEPRIALDGGVDGLDFYKRIINEAKTRLYANGFLLLEIGYNQGGALTALLEDAGFACIDIMQDYAGLDRVVVARNQI